MNNIPRILSVKGWSPYRLWQALGGRPSDRTLAYKLARPEESLDFKKWATMIKVAQILEVPLATLAANGEAEIEFQPGHIVPAGNNIPALLSQREMTQYGLAKALGGESSHFALAYKLGKEKESLAAKQWGTLVRVAEILGVDIADLAK